MTRKTIGVQFQKRLGTRQTGHWVTARTDDEKALYVGTRKERCTFQGYSDILYQT